MGFWWRTHLLQTRNGMNRELEEEINEIRGKIKNVIKIFKKKKKEEICKKIKTNTF